MNTDDLTTALSALLRLDPAIEDPSASVTRPLSSLHSDCEGFCGYAEEVTTDYLHERGFSVGYADLHAPGLGWFSTHYVTLVRVEEHADWTVVDFTAAQIPGYDEDAFPVVAALDDYCTATGLVVLEIQERAAA
jgi:hypothetical protein